MLNVEFVELKGRIWSYMNNGNMMINTLSNDWLA